MDMKKILIALLFMCMAFGGFVYAQTEGVTADEARALVYRAVALIELSGCDQAFGACNDTRGALVSKDLYIFVVDMNGKVLAHGAQNDMIGKNIIKRKDPYEKLIIRDMIVMSKTNNEGRIDYRWENPVTKRTIPKATYFRKIGDNLVCCEYDR
jgi:cytochrome c